MTQRLLLLLLPSTKPFSDYSLRSNPNPNPNPLDRLLLTCRPPNHRPIRLSLSRSLPPRHFLSQSPPYLASRAHQILLLLSFAAMILAFRLAAAVLLPDFPARWRRLAAAAAEAEAASRAYPAHLWRAVVAYEDRRFFAHFGVDPVGVARAVASLSARGGGSTITQQLVKNSFLKNERTLSRKLVEMVMSIALERKMSKQRILSCYVSKIYWGHGNYGIESASSFYFGKHPSLLTLGECALLVGIIPAPELRSPFKNPSRGKTYQARVLKRMVDVGFLDTETALSVLKQSLSYVDGSASVDGLSHVSSFFKEVKCDDDL